MHYCRPQILSSSPCCNTRALISLSSKSSLQFSWPAQVIKVLKLHILVDTHNYNSIKTPWINSTVFFKPEHKGHQRSCKLNVSQSYWRPIQIQLAPRLRLKSLGRQRYRIQSNSLSFIDEIDVIFIQFANLISCHLNLNPCMLVLVFFE